MSKVAIVYHSGYGHTAVIAEHVAKGAASVAGTTVKVIKAEELSRADAGPWDDLNEADAIIFGSPTYMGSAAWQLKQFMEASSKMWAEQRWKDKIAGGFTVSSSWSGDKLSTLTQMAVFAGQHGMIWAGLGMMPGNNNSKGSLEDLNRVGSFLGLMAQANADQAATVVPPAADQRTAELYGARIATIAARWKAGAKA